MRIIGGEFRKRRLQGPPDDTTTRPIPDMVKESLFNILRGHPEEGAVLDCFAGTGSIGLEALSRGAPRCVFVERDKRMAEILRANIEHCGAGDRAEVVVGDALGPGALSRCPRPIHLAFFDPPYPLVRSVGGWARVRDQFAKVVALLDDTGYAVLRTPWPFFHTPEEEAHDEGSFAKHHRREHLRRGDHGLEGADDVRGGRRSRRRGSPDSREHHAPPLGRAPDEADELEGDELEGMEEIEIDPTTPEGQALLAELMAAGAVEVDEDGQQIDGGEGAGVSGEPARDLIRGDLAIPGAIGPETHAYSGMAVHLYMRRR